jgi:hypothetical protein
MMAQNEGLTGILGMSDGDIDMLKSLAPYFNPIVSPWVTLGVGSLLGIYGNYQATKDRERAIKLNARMAELSPWTNMAPQQVSFAKPDIVSDMIGGIGTAQGVAGDINQFSPIYNAQKKIEAEEAARAEAARIAQENMDRLNVGMGPINEATYDATLAPPPLQSPFYNPPAIGSTQTNRLPEYRGQFPQQYEHDPNTWYNVPLTLPPGMSLPEYLGE